MQIANISASSTLSSWRMLQGIMLAHTTGSTTDLCVNALQ